jgi:alpha-L-rhamnosidase
VDEKVLENELYYSALSFAKKISEILKINKHLKFIDDRMISIKSNFEKYFWNENKYSSGKITDDRANALVILSKLTDQTKYEGILDVLLNVNNSTPYMESFVLESLFEMGFFKEGYERMLRRYNDLIENENSTLWEDFSILGSKNHAWSGSPLIMLYRYFAGISIEIENGYKVVINPYLADLHYIKASMMTKYGIIYLSINKKMDKIYIKVKKPARLTVTYNLDFQKLGVNSIDDIIIT